MAWKKPKIIPIRKKDRHGLIDPFAENEEAIHSSKVIGTSLSGNKVYEHCVKCHATFEGEFKRVENSEAKLAVYEGGLLHYRSQSGNEWSYRCICVAAKRNYKHHLEAPSWYWRLWMKQGQPPIVLHPEIATEPIVEDSKQEEVSEDHEEIEPPHNPLLPF